MKIDDFVYLAEEVGRLFADEMYREPDTDEVHPLVSSAWVLLVDAVIHGGFSLAEVRFAMETMATVWEVRLGALDQSFGDDGGRA